MLGLQNIKALDRIVLSILKGSSLPDPQAGLDPSFSVPKAACTRNHNLESGHAIKSGVLCSPSLFPYNPCSSRDPHNPILCIAPIRITPVHPLFVYLIQKHPLRHTQNNIWPNIWIP